MTYSFTRTNNLKFVNEAICIELPESTNQLVIDRLGLSTGYILVPLEIIHDVLLNFYLKSNECPMGYSHSLIIILSKVYVCFMREVISSIHQSASQSLLIIILFVSVLANLRRIQRYCR